MSKVVRIHQNGGPEQLRIEELEVGAPGAGEVRLRMEAIGLNRSEAMFRLGGYGPKPAFPTPIGYEGVGVIEALGPGVTGFAVGERVCVMPTYPMGKYGTYAERAIMPVRSLVAPPPGLSPIEAASIWMQYFTALAIIEVAHATVGDYVIIRAASSSVGLAAIQLANWAGAVPIAMTRRSTKTAASAAAGRQARHCHGGDRSGRGGAAHHRGQGRPHRVRSGWRSRRLQARRRRSGGGHPLSVRRPEPAADTLSALARGIQEPERARLGGVVHLEQARSVLLAIMR